MIGLRAADGTPDAPDLRLALPALGAWGSAAAVLVVGPGRSVLVLLALAAALAVVGAARLTGRTSHAFTWSVVASLVVALAVGAVAHARVVAIRPPVVRALVDARAAAAVELVVVSDPVPLRGRWSSDRVRVGARLERFSTSRATAELRVPVTLFAPSSWRDLLPGTRVRARGSFGSTTYRDEAALVVVRGPPTVLRPPGRVQRAAGALRAGLRAAVAGLPPDPRALVPGMVLGDTSAESADLKADERVAGLTHLTAVSGANVAILLAAVLGLARSVGLRRRARLVLAVAAVLAFVVVARPSPSVLRAAVMGCVVLVGLLRGSAARGPQALAGGVLLLLLVDPWLALSAGFALSVAATASLLLVAPHWRDRLARRMPRGIAEPLAVAAVAHIATAPLIASLSGRVSLVAVAANLAAEPAVVLVTVAGAVATVLGPLSPELARWAAVPAGWGARWVAEVAHGAAGLPLADVAWPAGIAPVLALGAASVAVLVGGPTLGSVVASSRPVLAVGAAWHASRDAQASRAPAPGDPRGRTGGSPRRARGRRGRHRRPRGRPRRRRPRAGHRRAGPGRVRGAGQSFAVR